MRGELGSCVINGRYDVNLVIGRQVGSDMELVGRDGYDDRLVFGTSYV